MDGNELLASALTAAGAPVWAGFIQGFIQVLKAVPQFESIVTGHEKLLCFVLAFVVVALAFWAGIVATPPTLGFDAWSVVILVMAWFTVARLAMAVYDDFISKAKPEDPEPTGSRPRESVLNATGWTGK